MGCCEDPKRLFCNSHSRNLSSSQVLIQWDGFHGSPSKSRAGPDMTRESRQNPLTRLRKHLEIKKHPTAYTALLLTRSFSIDTPDISRLPFSKGQHTTQWHRRNPTPPSPPHDPTPALSTVNSPSATLPLPSAPPRILQHEKMRDSSANDRSVSEQDHLVDWAVQIP